MDFDMQAEFARLQQAVSHEDPGFAEAALAIVTADSAKLAKVLRETPALVTAHSKSEHSATLVHYISANAIEDALQLSPASSYNRMRESSSDGRARILKELLHCIKLLVEAGADIDALASAYGGGRVQTPLNWLVSSGHPNVAGVLAELTTAFCEHGANPNGLDNDSSPVITAIGFGHPHAARALFDSGAIQDNLLLAAAAGNVQLLADLTSDTKFSLDNLSRCETDWFKPPTSSKSASELALVFAAMCGQQSSVRHLIDAGVDQNAVPEFTHVTGGALHTASFIGNAAMVDLLIELKCDPTAIEPRYKGNALDWAKEGGNIRMMQRVGHYLAEFIRRKHTDNPALEQFIAAVFAKDTKEVQRIIEENEFPKEQLNGPWFYFDAPAVVQAKQDVELVEVLVKAGANINQKSLWWAGGFGVLDETDSELADQLIGLGAQLDIWSACSLGKFDFVQKSIADDPRQLHRRGPDGKTALHCAKSGDIAKLLIDAGAHLNAKCLDHESTPVQYLVAKHPEVAQILIEAGCETDVMLAAALGDLDLMADVISRTPDAVDWIIDRGHFPSRAADHIYSWTLGWYLTPHQVANKFGKLTCVDFLFEKSGPTTTLLNACLLRRKDLVAKTLDAFPDVRSQLTSQQNQHVSHAARNSEIVPLEALLNAGFAIDGLGQHGATALHWAAFHGSCAMVQSILQHNPNLELKDRDYNCTPLQWVIEGAKNGWHKEQGDYPRVATLLRDAGCTVDSQWNRTGINELDEVLFS